MAKKLYEIETAFKSVYDQVTVSDMEGGADLPVTVYVCAPDIEEVPKRIFPSIQIMLLDMEFDPEMEGHDQSRRTLSVDLNTSQIVSRKTAHWYRLRYRVHSWCLYAKQDRDLVRRIENRVSPRDQLVVQDEAYWLFREEFISLDDSYSDRMIYHKVWTYEILADIDNSDTDITDRIVEEIQIKSYAVQTRADNGNLRPVNANGEITTASQAERFLHREFHFNDQQFWFPQE